MSPQSQPAPEPGVPALAELPTGLAALPEMGPDVVASRLRTVVVRWRWILAVILAAISIAVLVTIVPRLSGDLADVAMLVALVVLLAGLTTYRLVLALHGNAVAVSVDADHLNVSLPFNHARVRLAEITKVTGLRRDVLVEAKGAIERNGRLTGARWLPIEGVKGLEVDLDEFVVYLRQRIEQAITDTSAA